MSYDRYKVIATVLSSSKEDLETFIDLAEFRRTNTNKKFLFSQDPYFDMLSDKELRAVTRLLKVKLWKFKRIYYGDKKTISESMFIANIFTAKLAEIY